MENQYKYLGIIERALDPAQQKVCFADENSVIAAGAGSGKTQVLATRFAWLVISKKIKVSEILTLTFTDKAASEMYQRIYSTLKYFAEYSPKSDDQVIEFLKEKRRVENPDKAMVLHFHEAEQDLTQDKKALAAQALLDFTEARIQTLDSYCGSIVRQCANRYGISPDFSVGSSDTNRRIKDMAFKYVLKYINKACVKEFAEEGKIQEFAEKLLAEPIIKYTSIATEEGYFSNNFQLQKQVICQRWNEIICENKSYSLADLLNTISQGLESHKNKDSADKAVWVTALRDFLEKALDIQSSQVKIKESDFEDNYSSVMESVKQISQVLAHAKKVYKLKGAIRDVNTLLKPLTTDFAEEFESLFIIVEKYQEIKSMMEFYDSFLTQVNVDKRMTSSLTFTDVTEMALKILLENEDIRNNEKNSFKKIMIDEFQDNNSKNRDLLYLLSLRNGEFESKEGEGQCEIKVDSKNPEFLHDLLVDKRDPEKLFFVGDEKQSIYKFRNADVSVFNRLTSENKKIFMTYNYRSTPELIKAFNEFFKNDCGIFISGDEDSNRVDYEAHYTKDAEKNGLDKLPDLTKENVPIHMRFINEKLMEADKEMSPFYIPKDEQVAYDIASKIYEIASSEFAGKPKSEWKWENFAILDRSRGNREIITRYLNLFDIPYQVDQFKNIFAEGVINDFYNFLRLCVYPSDSRTFASYLCSPFCGLSENAVEIIFAHLIDTSFRAFNQEAFVFNPLNKAFDEKIQADLDSDDFNKFLAARKLFEDNQKNFLQQDITKTLSYLWNERGYKYETMLTAQAKLCSEHFDMLFELARKCEQDGKNLSWFVDELANLKTTMNKSDSDIDAANVSYPLERNHSIQIMTVHKSKGLQFDHVFILGCSSFKKNSDSSKYYFSEKTGISLNITSKKSNFFVINEKDDEEEKELAEFRRLIYVAITRAVKDVYIYGKFVKKDNSSIKFRLIKTMVEKIYPDIVEKDDYAIDGAVYNSASPFDYQAIKPITYNEISRGKENTDLIRERVIENLQKNKVIQEPFDSEIHGLERCQPSKLETKVELKDSYTSTKKDLYDRLTEIVRKYASDSEREEISEEIKFNSENMDQLTENQFQWTDYGTLIHDYLCKMALGFDPEKYEPAKKLLKNLSAEDSKEVLSICVNMCQNFKKSELYEKLSDAIKKGRFFRPEYEFKFYDGKSLFRGSIDLIFENEDGSYTLVDYKTDKVINPQIHAPQQDCYRQAAKDILPHPGNINCYLYYLRFEEEVPLNFTN